MADKIIKIACVIGTRPEVIKMAPVIQLLKNQPRYKVDVINTAQHRGLLDDMLKLFNIQPDIDFDSMRSDQSLALLTSRLFEHFDRAFANGYDFVLVQGDTTTTLVATQVAFYQHIAIGHVEAGLRSFDLLHPFPEEMNRVFVSKLATLHFTPTKEEEKILINEGIPKQNIITTGNTVIDSLLKFAANPVQLPIKLDPHKRLVLVTMHRRESFGQPLADVFEAFTTLITDFPDIEIVYPVHPNPNVRKLANEILANKDRIHLIEPVYYDQFISLMKHSYLIMSDSGGIQEEAPALDVPLLILRDVTERTLVVSEGMAKLVGTDYKKIVAEASTLLANSQAYQSMRKNRSPYGDGHASERIVQAIGQYFDGKRST